MPRPPILNPQAIPVVATDLHLPAVAGERLTADALRARFARGGDWQPEIPGDGRVLRQAPSAASVLVPLVQRPDGLHVLLTRRTDHLRDHAGQISFPGGRAEAHDADVVATALRETEEEVGLPAAQVEVIGRLPVYTTITNFVVTPVVGLVRPGFDLKTDPHEVAEVFEVPLAWLMDPSKHQRHAVEIDGLRREFISIPWPGVDDQGQPRRYFIWGATAAMLRNLYRFLSA